MKKAIGMNNLLKRKFETYEFEGDWLATFGKPEKNFSMSITGDSGHGKTDFCMKFAKYMAQFTRTLYCTYEEGIGSTIQEAAIRNNMQEVSGRVTAIAQESFEDLVFRLKKRASPRVVIIDSVDYSGLSVAQYKELRNTFPRKSFVVVSWAKGDKPKLQAARDMEFMSDVKILVHNYRAKPRSRFGGNKEFVIWDKPVAKQAQQTLGL